MILLWDPFFNLSLCFYESTMKDIEKKMQRYVFL
jgi:hypothetical protein